MITQDHLQVCKLTLTTRGLLHIGNGQKTPRKEYLYNWRKGTVSFLKEQAFFDLLVEQGLADKFEDYCLRSGGDLYNFLCKESGLTWKQIQPSILYQVSVGDALDANHTLKDVSRFVRDTEGRAYVPGSSVKGALRTALLYQIMAQDNEQEHPYQDMKMVEEAYLHTLGLSKDYRSNAVNSLMRGIQVSDSEPIKDDAMTLSNKQDGFVNGNVNSINLCRECVVPNTKIQFRLILDHSILKDSVTIASIMEAINAFAEYGAQVYESHFTYPQGCTETVKRNLLYLGGGAGFFSKSLIYPYLGAERGLSFTSDYLRRSFEKHHHKIDIGLGISPRTMKYGKYKGRLIPFGACEVQIT